MAYFEWDVRLLVLLASVVAAIIVMAATDWIKIPTRAAKPLLYVVVPVALLVIFYLLRVKAHYLGDGVLRIREADLGVWWLPTEPLAQAVNFAACWLGREILGITPDASVEMVSYLGGLLYYFALLGFVKTAFSDSSIRPLMFVCLYFSGMTLLFCGYAETYMLLPALIAWFFAAGIKSVRQQTSTILASLIFLILILMHFKALIFVPCMLLLAYLAWKDKRTVHAAIPLAAVMIALAIVVALPAISSLPSLSTIDMLLPLASTEPENSFLSVRYFLDILNEILLTATAAVILLIASFTVKSKSSFWSDKPLLFVAVAIPGAMAMLFLLHSRLGFGVDWDLFSSTTLILSFFAVMLFADYKELKLCRIAPVALSCVAFISFFSFAVVNNNFDIAVRRQIDILDLYGKDGAIGFETMGNHLNSIGHSDVAEQIWKKTLYLRPHVRVYSNLAQLALNQGRNTEAKYYSERGLELDSTRAMLWNRLGIVYAQIDDYVSADSCFRNAIRFESDDASYHHNYALMLAKTERWQEAEAQALAALHLLPSDPMIATTYGLSLLNQQKLADARQVFTQVIQMNPSLPDVPMQLSKVLSLQGDTLGARKVLLDFLAANPKTPLRERFETALSELR